MAPICHTWLPCSDTSDVEENPAPQKVRKSRFDERREPVEEKSEPANENKSER